MARKPIPLSEGSAIPRFALYRRVSTYDQVERDLSLPEQSSQQRDYVRYLGGIITHEFEDAGISAKNVEDRPDFKDMIETAKRHEFDALLVHNSNRAFRNRFDAITHKMILRKIGIHLRSVTEPWFGGDDPEDKLIEGVMECVAEYKLDDLSREVKKGLRSAANKEGRQNGTVPFGYRWADPISPRKGWEVCDEYAPWVRYAYEAIMDGVGVADLCREFNTLRIPTQRQRYGLAKAAVGWSRQAMHKMLRNRNYLGLVRFGGEEFPSSAPGIVDADLFECVQQILSRRGPGRSEGSDGLFSGGLLLCPLCAAEGRTGALTHAPYRNKRTGERIHRYQCLRGQARLGDSVIGIERPGCRGYGINESRVYEAVVETLEFLAGGASAIPSTPDLTALRSIRESRSRESDCLLRIEAAQREIENLPRIRERMTWQQQDISREEFMENLARLNQRAAELQAIIEEAQRASAQETALAPMEAAHVVAMLKAEGFTVQQKRDMLRAVALTITPDADKQGVTIGLRPREA